MTLPPPPRISSIPPQPVIPSTRTTIPAIARKSALRAAAERASDWGEAARSHLPEAIYSRVGRAPGIAVFGATAALVSLALIGLGVGAGRLYRSATAPAAARGALSQGTSEKPQATPAPLPAQAHESKPAATAPKATRDESAVLLDLADSLLAQHHDADVPSLLARLVARHPELKDNARLQGILLAAAASTDGRASSDSFDLLTGSMGEAGAALVYELSLKKDVAEVARRRAERWLGGKDFERTAALPVFAAEKLRAAKSCEQKHALLDFAGDAGGKYVLDYLHDLDRRTSCAPDDLEHCYPCMRSDNRLHATITKLESR
jgi:hypothetical protein